MISNNTSTCQDCGGKLKYYDKVRRIVRTKGRVSKWVNVPRYQCSECRCIHRYLPDYIYPYKQYESEIIAGVIEGLITCETFGYEDYPCEMSNLKNVIIYLLSVLIAFESGVLLFIVGMFTVTNDLKNDRKNRSVSYRSYRKGD